VAGGDVTENVILAFSQAVAVCMFFAAGRCRFGLSAKTKVMTRSWSKQKGWLRGVMADDLLASVMGSLVLLVYQDKGGGERPVGSGFIIATTELGALAMTATHVFIQMAIWEHERRKRYTSSPFVPSWPLLDLSAIKWGSDHAK